MNKILFFLAAILSLAQPALSAHAGCGGKCSKPKPTLLSPLYGAANSVIVGTQKVFTQVVNSAPVTTLCDAVGNGCEAGKAFYEENSTAVHIAAGSFVALGVGFMLYKKYCPLAQRCEDKDQQK